MDINMNSHISLISNDDVKKICMQFFQRKKIDINHINYIHKNCDGTVYYLCSNNRWLSHYFKNRYMDIGAFETKSHLSNDRYVLWDTLDSNDVILKDSRDLINVYHGLTVVEKTKNGVDFFNFGNNCDVSTLNTYVNSLYILNEFIPHFYNAANSLLKEAAKTPILINASNHTEFKIASDNKNISDSIHLSKREIDCINWYLKGKNSGDIALILGISRRTVETYIENVKGKLGCANLFQLGYSVAALKLSTNGFIPQL